MARKNLRNSRNIKGIDRGRYTRLLCYVSTAVVAIFTSLNSWRPSLSSYLVSGGGRLNWHLPNI